MNKNINMAYFWTFYAPAYICSAQQASHEAVRAIFKPNWHYNGSVNRYPDPTGRMVMHIFHYDVGPEKRKLTSAHYIRACAS